MAIKKRAVSGSQTTSSSRSALQAARIPDWLERVRSRVHVAPEDAARKIFLERAFDAVIEITGALHSSSLEETAAAGSNVLVLLKALQSPELLPELERYEPLASPYLRGLEAQKDLLHRAGGLMTSEEVAKLLRLTRQAVDKRRQKGALLAIPQGRRGYGYPVCQFTARGTLSGLEQTMNALGETDGWMRLTFLLSPNAALDDIAPLDLLKQGRVSSVVGAAEIFGEHGAS